MATGGSASESKGGGHYSCGVGYSVPEKSLRAMRQIIDTAVHGDPDPEWRDSALDALAFIDERLNLEDDRA